MSMVNSLRSSILKFTVDHALFVIPERFELSTPGLKDRCSNHLSYEIICNLNSE